VVPKKRGRPKKTAAPEESLEELLNPETCQPPKRIKTSTAPLQTEDPDDLQSIIASSNKLAKEMADKAEDNKSAYPVFIGI